MNKAEILIIDDEPQIRKLLEITLESNDYKAVSYTHLDVYKRQCKYAPNL